MKQSFHLLKLLNISTPDTLLKYKHENTNEFYWPKKRKTPTKNL